MKKKILVAVDDFSEAHIHAITAAVTGWAEIVRLPQASGEAVYRNALAASHICIGWPPAEWLFNTSVQLLQTGSSGWENYQHKGLDQLPAFSLCTAKGIYSIGVAEHAIAMMMTLGRALDINVLQQAKGHFDKIAIPPNRLWVFQGRTLLVVGLGGIGTQVAEIAHGLGMTVLATNPSDRKLETVSYVGRPAELPNLVGKTDVVVLAAPLTPDTQHLFNAAMFARMKKGALLINVASGGEVVSEDLVAALKSGQLGGAGLDLADPENPSRLAPTDPLFSAPNLIMSPETASHAVDTTAASGGEDMWIIARENLKRYVAGDKLYSLVDAKRGY